MNRRTTVITTTSFIIAVALLASTITAGKLPAEKAGTIGELTGQIAFIRNKDIWVMNANGSAQRAVTEVQNADGRLSWSPNGREIMFVRSGTVDLKGPDFMGGRHKVYDLFKAFLDSVDNNNTLFWYRITTDLGSRDPEWRPDGTIIFTKDINANQADAVFPNYQICTMDSDGSNFEILRKDWQNMPEFFMSPTINSKGEIAFVHMYSSQDNQPPKPQGIAVLAKDKFMTSIDKVRVMSKKNAGAVNPAWSPDGKWLAYVSNDIKSPGLFIMTADLSSTYMVFEPPIGTYLYTFAPSFSADSKWLTFSTTDGSIWVCDITGNKARRLSGPGNDKGPAWSK